MTDRICAIVVTYQPDLALLRENLAACRAQVDCLVVVDNASDHNTQSGIHDLMGETGCEILQLTDNFGVAAAQNCGVARARLNHCDSVIFLDQDSKPAPGMVNALQQATHELAAKNVHVAAVGPRLLDRRTGKSTPFVRVGLFGISRTSFREGDMPLIPVDFLVSSGMLIALTILDQVGFPEEALFIDNVALEWCFRARAMGLALYGVCDAVMEHSVGDDVFQIGGRVIHRHGPLRQYYIMRNRILLYRRPYSPWGWLVQDFFRMLFKFAVFSLFFPPRLQNLRMMVKGIRDGLKGRSGKYC